MKTGKNVKTAKNVNVADLSTKNAPKIKGGLALNFSKIEYNH